MHTVPAGTLLWLTKLVLPKLLCKIFSLQEKNVKTIDNLNKRLQFLQGGGGQQQSQGPRLYEDFRHVPEIPKNCEVYD